MAVVTTVDSDDLRDTGCWENQMAIDLSMRTAEMMAHRSGRPTEMTCSDEDLGCPRVEK